ncbi:MAG: bifunctional transaldolase/phosoglucose isomerase, partial [Anaerolineae bacterium]|nr:bifunctional transaldolase/phosoglucose isomerase [Anaerolineae bacterium]
MSNNTELYALGQSLWYDNISREIINTGELKKMIDDGDVYGVTSNPSIFMKAIASTNAYDDAIQPMSIADWDPVDIFWQLAVEDIQAGADILAELYQKTNRGDGYISLEVDPNIADDTEATIQDVQRLWHWVDRPNLCVKIPATKAGLPAIRQSIAAGINVNVTLIFSPERYQEVMEAYLSGLEDRLAAGQPIDHIHSVASVFVSRIDGMVDPKLRDFVDQGGPLGESAIGFIGKTAVASTRFCYKLFKEVFSSERYRRLEEAGAHVQRPLWASTGTKDPAYSPTKYIDELIAPQTVNTAPPNTIAAYKETGAVAYSVERFEDEAEDLLQSIGRFGIDMHEVYETLEVDGVKAFSDAFAQLMDVIQTRKEEMKAQIGHLAEATAAQIDHLKDINASERMANLDATLWTEDPAGQAEIVHRLGWIDAPWSAMELMPTVLPIAADAVNDGFTHCTLLGMGGSSLAPEVERLTLGIGEVDGKPGLDLAILDSTDPGQVAECTARAPIEKTIFIVASKSGSTAEVHAFMEHFWKITVEKVGEEAAGDHFIVITDPGSMLIPIAEERNFRAVVISDPNVGGRFSAMTAFGITPAALMGFDVEDLLMRAQKMAQQCKPGVPAGRNPGLVLGALIGEASLQGRDKLGIINDPAFDSLGSWLEQLIAESSGKNGKGIVPIDGEPVIIPPSSEKDRLYVYVRQDGSKDGIIKQLRSIGHPVLVLDVPCTKDLFAEFYRWEMAISYACMLLGVNTFDQPNVQLSKSLTKEYIKRYHEEGSLDLGKLLWENSKGAVYGQSSEGLPDCENLKDIIAAFTAQAAPGDYIAINAYLPRNEKMTVMMEELRKAIAQHTQRAVSLGFGPRFQHSTGQLHKGGKNNILVLYITAEPEA